MLSEGFGCPLGQSNVYKIIGTRVFILATYEAFQPGIKILRSWIII
jgi:hypothetical protein